jgi:hypothetical protein
MEVTIVRSKQVPQVSLKQNKFVPSVLKLPTGKFKLVGSLPEDYADKIYATEEEAKDALKEIESRGNKRNEKTWPTSYKCNFLEPGIVSYEDVGQGIALLKKESMDNWINSFKGKPVIIDHQNVSPENFKEAAVGYITDVYYNAKTGWYDAEFIITDDEGHEAIKDGYSVSCSFDVKNSIGGGEWHASKYDEEITQGEGLHLALVTSPRYEDCRIVVNSKRATVENADPEDWAFKSMREKGYVVSYRGSGEYAVYKSGSSDKKIISRTELEELAKGMVNSKKATVENRSLQEGDEITVRRGDSAGCTGKIELISGDSCKVRTPSGSLFTFYLKDLIPRDKSIPDLSNEKYKVTVSIDGEAQDMDEVELVNPYKDMSNVELEAKLRQIPSQMSIEPNTDRKLEMEEEAKLLHQEIEKRKASGEYIPTNEKQEVDLKNSTDFSVMSPIQVDKYMETLSDVGLQTIVDGDHPGDIKKLAQAHIGDRAKKAQAEEIAGATGAKPAKKKEASKMWKLFAKKEDKASLKNDKIDASKVFVDVEGEKVPLSTLANSMKEEEMIVLSESDTVKINGKDVKVSDMVKAYKKTNEFKKEEEEEKKDDAKEEEEVKNSEEKEEKEDDKKCKTCGASLKKNEGEEEKKDDDKKEKNDEKSLPNPQTDEGDTAVAKNSKNNGKEFFMDLENAKNSAVDSEVGKGPSGTSTREDRAANGKKFFGSKKKNK